MKKLILILLCFLLPAGSACAEAPEAAEEPVTCYTLAADLAESTRTPSPEASARVRADLEILDDPLARAVAAHWEATWLNPDYPLYIHGTDDPSLLPVTGRHAFVVLGFALRDGEMAEELVGRCKAAAAAAKAFPDSIIVCTGGATGANNPDGHTEAGLMKEYLVKRCGISRKRILTEELSRTTADNAVNTLQILREHGIETMTLVTSDYHQLWAQTLYHAQAEKLRLRDGWSVEIIGNYNWPAATEGTDIRKAGLGAVVSQLTEIMKRP